MTVTQRRALLGAVLRRARGGFPPQPGPGQSTRFSVPDNWLGIRYFIGRIRAAVVKGLSDPACIKFARAVVLGCRSNDKLCEARTIFDVVKGNMRFVDDPIGREVLQTANRMTRFLRAGILLKAAGKIPPSAFVASGDCDEFATITTTLAGCIAVGPLALGFGGSGRRALVRGRVVSTYHHVWGEVFIGGRWVPMDAAAAPRLGQVSRFTSHGRLRIL